MNENFLHRNRSNSNYLIFFLHIFWQIAIQFSAKWAMLEADGISQQTHYILPTVANTFLEIILGTIIVQVFWYEQRDSKNLNPGLKLSFDVALIRQYLQTTPIEASKLCCWMVFKIIFHLTDLRNVSISMECNSISEVRCVPIWWSLESNETNDYKPLSNLSGSIPDSPLKIDEMIQKVYLIASSGMS